MEQEREKQRRKDARLREEERKMKQEQFKMSIEQKLLYQQQMVEEKKKLMDEKEQMRIQVTSGGMTALPGSPLCPQMLVHESWARVCIFFEGYFVLLSFFSFEVFAFAIFMQASAESALSKLTFLKPFAAK